MAPSSFILPFYPLGNLRKRVSPSQWFQQKSKGWCSLFLIGWEEITNLSLNQSQRPRAYSVLTVPQTLAHLSREWSQGGSLKEEWECCWLRKQRRTLDRQNYRHPLLLWSRGGSLIKVTVKTFRSHSGGKDQQWTIVAIQLGHVGGEGGNYSHPQGRHWNFQTRDGGREDFMFNKRKGKFFLYIKVD